MTKNDDDDDDDDGDGDDDDEDKNGKCDDNEFAVMIREASQTRAWERRR